MRNVGLEEAQAGIKIAGRNVNNLKYADDTTLMAESEEELKRAAALCWSSCEEIPHIQGKRNPSKMVGAERGHQRADTLKT